jgi:Fe-S cluster assembly protein SufD
MRGSQISIVSVPDGVTIERLSEVDTAPDIADLEDFLVALNQATMLDGVCVRVGRGQLVAEPIVIVHEVTAGFSASRVSIDLGEGAACEVIEVFVGGDDTTISLPVTETVLGASSSLLHSSIQLLESGAWHLGTIEASVERDANLTQFIAGIGASYDRCRNDVALVGEGASSTLRATYHGQASQVHDLRTNQDHRAPKTISNMLCKGAVRDESHSIYSGMIRMRHGAIRSDAVQTNHNLVLDEAARADSVPNLEIEENDVRCAHGSTVGPLDEDQRFYLEARGIDPDHVETLLVQGFYASLLSGVSKTAAAIVRPSLDTRLSVVSKHG